MSKKLRLNVTIKKHLPLAIDHHKKGETEQAAQLYGSLFRKYPQNIDLLHFYGRLKFETGELKEGMDLVRKSVKLDPQYADALNNLGNMYSSVRRYKDAQSYYKKALSANPRFYDAIVNLGVVSRHFKDLQQAEQCYREAIDNNPTNFSAYNNLIGLLRSSRRYDEAFEIMEIALQYMNKNPEHEQGIFSQQSRLYYSLGQTEQAIAVYQKWLNKYPDNAVAKHMVASLQGENAIAKSDSDYVKTLFDSFSSSFDDVLEGLQYKAPELTGNMVEQHFSQHPKYKNGAITLDAGCGTGLCGRYLKPVSDTLIGIDLSGGMISRARALNEYDSLIVAEIEEYLSDNTDSYDLMVSADTFCYFGALESLFSKCRASLQHGGMLIFTLEQLVQKKNTVFNDGYFLNPHGRYSHSENYVTDALTNAGLTIKTIDHDILRMEYGEAVQGMIVLAEKPLTT